MNQPLGQSALDRPISEVGLRRVGYERPALTYQTIPNRIYHFESVALNTIWAAYGLHDLMAGSKEKKAALPRG
jgi:hypothetical protein